jgi:hypothetical protein
MRFFIETTSCLVGVVCWLAGIGLAQGVWSTIFAVLIVPYAWYLVVVRLMQNMGWI